MKLKRAIGIGVVTYIVSFIFGIVTALLMGIDLSNAEAAPQSVWVIGIFGTVVIVSLSAFWYFKKVKANLKEGFKLGLVFVIVSFLIEFLLVIPYIITSGSPASMIEYYSNPLLWLSIALLIVSASLVGEYKGRQ
jgi:hypothetical protein